MHQEEGINSFYDWIIWNMYSFYQALLLKQQKRLHKRKMKLWLRFLCSKAWHKIYLQLGDVSSVPISLKDQSQFKEAARVMVWWYHCICDTPHHQVSADNTTWELILSYLSHVKLNVGIFKLSVSAKFDVIIQCVFFIDIQK